MRACQCAPSKKCPVCTPCTIRTHSAPARGGRRRRCWRRWGERDRRVSSTADGAGGRTRWRAKWGLCVCVCVSVLLCGAASPALPPAFPLPSSAPALSLSSSIQVGFPTSQPCLSQEWYSQTFSELFIDRCQLFSIPLVCTLWEMRGLLPLFLKTN